MGRIISRTHGTDSHGNPVKLGDTDTGGYYVGYISENGTCWESVREHDLTLTEARYRDGLIAWRNGEDSHPVIGHIARTVCLDKRNRYDAIRNALEANDPTTPLNRALAAYARSRGWDVR